MGQAEQAHSGVTPAGARLARESGSTLTGRGGVSRTAMPSVFQAALPLQVSLILQSAQALFLPALAL